MDHTVLVSAKPSDTMCFCLFCASPQRDWPELVTRSDVALVVVCVLQVVVDRSD